MAQLFSRNANTIARLSLLAAVGGVAAVACYGYWIAESPYETRQDVPREQPVPFSHEHHVGGLGIDCRYCHTTVETSSFANIPATKICMNCHSQMWAVAADLSPCAELPIRQVDPVDARARSSGLCLFRPQYSCEPGNGMFHLSWPGGPYAFNLAGGTVADGMVSGLSPESREIRPAARPGVRHELQAASGSTSVRTETGRRIPYPEPYELFDMPSMNPDFVPLESLTKASAPRYWRSLDELTGRAGTPEPEPDGEDDLAAKLSPSSRRRFIELMGASLGLAGLTACTRQPTEFIVPYVDPPESAIPGRPRSSPRRRRSTGLHKG